MATIVVGPGSPLARLEELSVELTQRDIVQLGVEVAEAATSSRIAYLHFINPDQETIELGTWSKATLAGCRAVHLRHYPIVRAGIWADAFWHRAPCVHNDYAGVRERRGLPQGHSPLTRHLGVPLLEDDAVRLLVGVGNKATPYDDDDVGRLEYVARRVWSALRQRRLLERYMDQAHHLRGLQRRAGVCAFEYDPGVDRLEVDAMFPSLFGPTMPVPVDLAGWLACLDASSRPAVRDAVTTRTPRDLTLRLSCRRDDGTSFAGELALHVRAREVGHGVVLLGTMHDLSNVLLLDELRHRASTDPLTGLANRAQLTTRLETGWGQGRVALHFLDLDGFKPINDRHGHAVGDETLRVVAQRLRHAVRADDVVARLGGDEFVVLQAGVTEPGDAEGLAASLVDVLRAPMNIGGVRVTLGVSVGVALSEPDPPSLLPLLTAADRAMYDAKVAGGDRWQWGHALPASGEMPSAAHAARF